jgi:hypothetical protein
MKTADENDPVEVFAGTTWQAGMIKSLLEDAGIEAFMRDQIIGTYNPWWTAPGGAGSVTVFVARKNLGEALKIAEQYQENLKK